MNQYITIPATALRETAYELSNDGKNTLMSMFANDERSWNGNFAIYCLFSVDKKLQGIKAVLAENEVWEFPSITPKISAAAWYEREIYDLFGLKPIGHPDLRPLVLHENWPKGIYPLRKEFAQKTAVPTVKQEFHMATVEGEGVFEVPVGPIHAGIIEPGHFRFSQAGDDILRLDAKLFFLHRGIEKAIEGVPLERAFYRIERISGICTVAHSLSYCQAIENIAGVTVPPRAQYLRALVGEMERLYNHVGDIGNLCAGMGFAVGIMAGARLKEDIMRVNEALTGHRFLRGMVIPGGVRLDITDDLTNEIIAMLNKLMPDFNELIGMFKGNNAFLNRVETTGIVPPQAARDLGLVGIGARASGVDVDIRRDFPYGCYSFLKFDVPVYHEGDVAARLWVRVDEVVQSVNLIHQILANMPQGPLKVDIPAIQPYSSGFGWCESPQGNNIHWLMVGENNTVYRLHARAAAYPNWPALTVAAPGNIIPDFPLINKSFELSYACVDR